MATRDKHAQNELERLFEKATPFVEQHGNKLLLGMAAIMLIAAIAIFTTRRSSASSGTGWTEMAAANTTEDYASIADRFPESEVGLWAKLVEADGYLSNGIEAMFVDRVASKDDLAEAKKAYEVLLNSGSVPNSIRERALFGLAQTIEAGCTGDTSEVMGAYKKLLEEFPSTVYGPAVDRRITALESKDASGFYAWFQKQNPKPSDLPRPQDGLIPGMPPSAPPRSVTLPETPPLLEIPGLEAEAAAETEAAPDAAEEPGGAPAADADAATDSAAAASDPASSDP